MKKVLLGSRHKLAELKFSLSEKGVFEGSRFILPMHAEKWTLIQEQEGWDRILSKVDIFFADGAGLAWGYRLITGNYLKKISGIDLIDMLIKDSPQTPTYIWGTRSELVKKAANVYKSSGLNVVGFHDGFTGSDEKVLEDIKKSGAKVCFIGMGALRAASLALRVHEELGITTMTAGGSFDVAGGKQKRAPQIFRKNGFEWLWRMIIEPSRVKRFPRLLRFIWYIIKEKYEK